MFILYRRKVVNFYRRDKTFLKVIFYIYSMILRWLFGKKRDEELKEATKKGFEDVKKDIHAVSGWIKHLDSEKKLQQKDMEDLKQALSSMQTEIEGLKNVMSIMGNINTQQVFKTPRPLSNKQTAVLSVQTPVATGVQSPNLDQFSVTERAILWILLNSDLKLSYDDLAAMLGKERSTIRGQINSIKQKSGDNVISEIIEKNGKKRVYIPEEIREKLLKKQKVRVKSAKKPQKK